MRLVLLVHLRAERFFRFVEDHREMGRPLIRLHLLEQLPQHAAETVDRIDMRAIGGARLEPDRMVSAEDVTGTVHQEYVVALFNGTGRALAGLRLVRPFLFWGSILRGLACAECGPGGRVNQSARISGHRKCT